MLKRPVELPLDTLPLALQTMLSDAKIYDSSCSASAQTYLIEKSNSFFLKIAPLGCLTREEAMYNFLAAHHLSPAASLYVQDAEKDYLITQALDGEDGIAPEHLQNPERLAQVFGQSLHQLHSLPTIGCPYPNRMAEMAVEINEKRFSSPGDLEILSEGKAAAWQKYQSMQHLAQNDAVLHGDYCLPNIVLKNFQFQGFLDLGYGGVGDRHYDLWWGIWTLWYNLKTHHYRDAFTEAYGRERIDPDRLELCRLVAGLTG
jgi:kanamycin kinase